MPPLRFSPQAIEDLIRLRNFLAEKSIPAANMARDTIAERIENLPSRPEGYKPVEDYPELRDMVIKFGAGSYIARYRYVRGSEIVILRVRHEREDAFTDEDNQLEPYNPENFS
jgi:plasmid stabilization system protein ParE